MAEEAETVNEAAISGSWNVETEAILRDMWTRRYTASQIGDRLGFSRNAVVGKARRLGLKSTDSKAPTDPHDDRWLFLADANDPIRQVLGESVRVKDLLGYKWPHGPRYLANDTLAALNGARSFVEPNAAPILTADQFLVSMIKWGGNKKRPMLRRLYPIVRPALRKWEGFKRHRAKLNDEILRWDVVDILATAANLRSRLLPTPAPIDIPLILMAYFYTPAGQQALVRTGLGDAELRPFREYALEVFVDYASTELPPESRALAKMIVAEVNGLQRFRGANVQRAGFASDTVDRDNIDQSIARDARALADLILLEAAAPPLAIGVFGSWGSGKSTLLGALKSEISEQTQQEQALISDGLADEDPATRRVANILQIELNAWTFADSANLWASLTSDIFEQIAAGGKDQASAAVGTKLVAEVIERTNKEALLHRSAQAKFDASEARVKAANYELKAARLDAQISGVDAAFHTALELLGPEPKNDDAAEGVKASEPDYVTIFRTKVLLDGDTTNEERIRKYAEAGTPAARLGAMVIDRIKAIALRTWIFVALGGVLAGLVGYYGVGAVLPFAKAYAGSLAPLFLWIGLGAKALAPVLRVASHLGDKLREARRSADERIRKAEVDRDEAEKAKAEAAMEIAKSREVIEKFAQSEDGTLAPSLVLSYLLEESAEITQLRSTLGTLGTVRKAFERLNAILQDASTKRDSHVQRIIIYLDDLDRCSKDQVVKIIEAIHLLLAFPCFVVVAAVDARWLQTALTEAHSQIGDIRSGVTAADYLEKIFQIAYWVRPLKSDPDAFDGGTYGRLIDALAGNWETKDFDASDENGIEDEAPEEVDDETSTSPFEAVPPSAPDYESAVERVRVKFTLEEMQLFHKLGGLASRSPRAVKKMINIYRIMRANSETEGASIMILGPDAERVPAPLIQFALACEAGLSSHSMSRLARAVETASELEWNIWSEFIDGRKPHYDGLLRKAFDRSSQFDQFFMSLADVRSDMYVTLDQTALKAAFELAGRYSFRMPGGLVPEVEPGGSN